MSKLKRIQFSGNKYYGDNFDDISGLKEVCRDFLNNVMNNDHRLYGSNIDELEYKSRDGFIAYNHNCGGLDLITIHYMIDIQYEGLGTSQDEKIEKLINEKLNMVKRENFENSEVFEQAQDDIFCSVYDAIGLRIRIMYQGNGVLKIYTEVDFDAPYFRFRDQASQTYEIKFKTIAGLKTQLKKITKKIDF